MSERYEVRMSDDGTADTMGEFATLLAATAAMNTAIVMGARWARIYALHLRRDVARYQAAGFESVFDQATDAPEVSRTADAGLGRFDEGTKEGCTPDDLCTRAQELIAEVFGVEEGIIEGKTTAEALLEIRRLVKLRPNEAPPADDSQLAWWFEHSRQQRNEIARLMQENVELRNRTDNPKTEPDLLKRAIRYLALWFSHDEDGDGPWHEHHAEVQALVDMLRPARAPCPETPLPEGEKR